jgi:ribosomal protein S18 acetylase RimI-like enzyme
MANSTPIPLTPRSSYPGRPDFQRLLTWAFRDEPFYEGQVLRSLRDDIRHRVRQGRCRFWTYQDPAGNVVGFGSLELSGLYSKYVGGKPHYYIPLLAVNPGFLRLGHGKSIVRLLVEAATIQAMRCQPAHSDVLFLDVYTANQPAVDLYVKNGFEILNPDAPIPDPEESDETYFVMGRRLDLNPFVQTPTPQIMLPPSNS